MMYYVFVLIFRIIDTIYLNDCSINVTGRIFERILFTFSWDLKSILCYNVAALLNVVLRQDKLSTFSTKESIGMLCLN